MKRVAFITIIGIMVIQEYQGKVRGIEKEYKVYQRAFSKSMEARGV